MVCLRLGGEPVGERALGCTGHDSGRAATAGMPTAKAQRSVLLGLARAGERLVAVGERGIVLLCDDAGVNWRQAKVPVSVSLTAVQVSSMPSRAGRSVIWAWCCTPRTAEKPWQKQLDGQRAIALAVQFAERDVNQPDGASHLAQARRMLDDGPDKPFLDLYFSDRLHGYVVGAYNQIYRTDDGGRAGSRGCRHVDNPQGLNLYGIRALGNDLWLVGERGLLLRSTDAGQSFQALTSPYEGGFFGLLGTRDGALVVYGLRGNAWWSGDRGNSWRRLDTGIDRHWRRSPTARRRPVVGQPSGELLFSHDQGRSFDKRPEPQRPGRSLPCNRRSTAAWLASA